MDRVEPKDQDTLSVGREFYRSRLAPQFSACAYEILVPEVRRQLPARGRAGLSRIGKQPMAATGA